MTTSTPTRSPRGSIGAGQHVTFGPLATERGLVTVAFLVILAAGILLTTTPRLVTQVTEEGLNATLEETSPPNRNMESVATGRISPGETDPFGWVQVFGQQVRGELFTPVLQDHFPDTRYVVDTPQLSLKPVDAYLPDDPGEEWLQTDWEVSPDFGVYLSLRYMEGIEGKVSLSEGRMPESRDVESGWIGENCPQDGSVPVNPWIYDDDGIPICFYLELFTAEAVFSQETLDVLGMSVGDRMVVRNPFMMGVEVVGVLAVDDLEDDYWFGQNTVAVPALNMVFTPGGLEIEDAFLLGVVSPDVYGDLLDRAHQDFTYTYRFFLDRAGVDPEVARELSSEIRQLQVSQFPPPFETLHVNTGLPQVIDNFFRQLDRALNSLSTSMFGVAASALAVVGMLAYLIENRQRSGLVLVRNRGGSRSQLTVSQALQALVIAVPALAVAYLTALLLSPYDSGMSRVLAVVMILAVPLMFIAAAYPTIHADLGSLQRSPESASAPTTRRRVAEFMIIVLAVMAVALVLRRGADADRLDVMRSAIPALLAIAGGLIASRLLALPVGVAAWIGTKLSGVTTFIGFRRARQQAPKARVPMLVIVLTVALAVVAFLTWASVQAADVVTSYETVGADFRVASNIEGRRLPEDLNLADVDGVQKTALGLMSRSTRGCMVDRTRCDVVDALVVEAAVYQQVLAGSPADPGLPASMTDPDISAEVGTESHPIPAIVSSSWQASGTPTIGRVFTLGGQFGTTWFVVAEVRDAFPGLDPRRPFVVADLSAVEAAGIRARFNATTLFLRADAGATDVLDSRVAEWNPDAVVESRHQLLAEMRGTLLSRTVQLGLLASLAVLAVFAALATIGFVVLTDRSRLRDLGFLRTIGLSTRQAKGIAVIEVVTTVSVAALIGALIAVGAVRLLAGPMGLQVVAGASPVTVATVTVLVTIIAIFALLSTASSGGSRDLTRILKMGDE